MPPSFSHTLTVRALRWNIMASWAGVISYVVLIHRSVDGGLFPRMRDSSLTVLRL
jgi:hypothetical protein